MIEIKFFPIDIDYIEREEGIIIRIFGKTITGEKICVLDKSFKPNFLVIPEDNTNLSELLNQIKKISFEFDEKIIQVLDAELTKKKYLGKKVNAIKVFVRFTKEIKLIREYLKAIKEIKSIEEYDISSYKKYLIENKITPLSLCKVNGNIINTSLDVDIYVKGKVSQETDDILENPKVLSFDIETSNPASSVQGDNQPPIIMIGLAGSDGFRKCITWKEFKTSKKEIEFVSSEVKLLKEFKNIIKSYKPDYIVGYYSDGFDWPYIKARADFLKIDLDIGLDKKVIKFKRRAGNTSSVKINGIPHIDIWKFIKQIMSGDVASGSLQTQSYSLDSVAEEILGENKISLDILDLSDAWENNKGLEKFCLYNLKDAELCLRIFEKITPNINELVKIVSQPIYDVSKMTYGQLIENYLMKKTVDFNEIILKKPSFGERKARMYNTYTGGFVFEPKPGLYENLAVLDFRGLHPSIISAHNICLSTITDDKENSNESPEIDGIKFHFSYKEEGFIPQIVKELIERRIRIKEIIKKNESPVLKARSYALKIIAAGFHGYTGYFGARWYSIECSAAILAYARFYIKKLISKVEEFGFTVIYGDTDSVFIEIGNKNKDDILKFLKDFNNELPSLMELELESFYERGIFVGKKSAKTGAKKKYALINENKEIKIRGFEIVRRGWSNISKNIQRKVFEFILKENNVQKALDYVRKEVNEIKNKKLNMEDMVIRTQLNKNINDYESIGPHVAVAKQMLKKNIKVGPGSIIQYIVTKGTGLIRDRAKLVEDATDYDADYYINHQILPSIQTIFEVLGYKKEDLLEDEDQSKLKSFVKNG